jgi:hypothetical protein
MKRAGERSGLGLKYSKIVIFLNSHDLIESMAMENISIEKVSIQCRIFKENPLNSANLTISFSAARLCIVVHKSSDGNRRSDKPELFSLLFFLASIILE